MREIARGLTDASGVTVDRVPAMLSKRVAAGVAIDSTSVFHAPQCGHCPCHFGA